MSKFVYFIVLGGLALAAIVAVNVGIVSAGEETRSVQFSVLAEDQANYGVDKDFGTIPAVSADIITDKIRDMDSVSSIPTIKYTTLPAETSDTDNDEGQSVNQRNNHNKNKQDNDGKGNSNQQRGGNENKEKNSNSNQNNNNPNNGNETNPASEVSVDNPSNNTTEPEDVITGGAETSTPKENKSDKNNEKKSNKTK
jgi:hypothetical protein